MSNPKNLPDTPTLDQVISTMVERKLLDIHTSIPGIVESYNAEKKTCTVKPALKKTLLDGTELDHALLTDVPVGFYQTDSFIFSFPLKKGDTVNLIVSERSLDIWKVQGGVVNPKDPRKFNLSDAIAYPSIKPVGKGMPVDTQHALIQHGSAFIKLSQDGKFAIGNGSNEVLSILQELATACANIITNTQIGPQPPINAASFSVIANKIGGMKL